MNEMVKKKQGGDLQRSDEDQILLELYKSTLDVLEKGISVGSANVPLAFQALDAYFDILHGGAKYPQKDNVGNEAIPSILALNLGASDGGVDLSPSSPYYVGVPFSAIVNEIKNPAGESLTQLLSNDLFLFGASDAANVIADANVPTIFPKILSDQFYARWVLFRDQIAVTQLFTNVGTGLKTYVEAAKGVAGITKALSTAATDASDNQ